MTLRPGRVIPMSTLMTMRSPTVTRASPPQR